MNLIVILFKRLKSHKLTLWLRMITMGVGMASALVLFYIALNELSTDSFYPDKNRIYQVFDNFKSPDYSGVDAALVQPLVPDMVSDFPGIAVGTEIFNNDKTNYKVNESLLEANTLYADSLFFKVFKRRFITGTAKHSLRLKNTAVITQKLAQKLFGNSLNATGKIIYLKGVRPITIIGVIDNWPVNSSFKANVILSFATLKDENRLYMGWGGGDSFSGFVKLAQHTNYKKIEKGMPAFLRKYYDVDADESQGFFSTYQLIPLAKATFIINPDKKIIYAIMIFIGVLLFGLVCFNSLLLILAGYRKFIKEIAIHRTLGASAFDIQKLIFNEALFYMLASSVVAFLFLLLINPFIKANFQFGIIEAFSSQSFLLLFLLVFIIAFFVIYLIPVRWSVRYFMASQKTQSFLKPLLNTNLQRALLTLQIGISLSLFVFLFFINSQFNFIRNFNKGYDANQLVYIQLQNKPLYTKDAVIKSEIAKIPNVLSVCLSDAIPLWELSGNGFSASADGQNLKIVRNFSVDKDFFTTLKIKLKGSGFKGSASHDKSVIITRKAAKLFGFQQPVGKNIYRNGSRLIAGLADDFVSGSLHSAVQPTVFSRYQYPSVYSVITARISAVGMPTTVQKIKKTIQRIVPGQIVQVAYYDASLRENYRFDRTVKNTVSFFSILAALITLAGLIGFSLSMINTRTKELGIRKINGASTNDLLLLLNRVFMWNIAVAFVIFIPVSYQISKLWLQQYAYAVSLKWGVFVWASILVMLSVFGVVSIFTLRAVRKNPVEALRYE